MPATSRGRIPDVSAPDDDRESVLSFIPDLLGRRRVSTSLGGVTHSLRGAGEISMTTESHYATVFLQPVKKVLTTVGGDKLQEIDVPAGAVGVAPFGTSGKTIWPTARETVAIVIPPDRLAELAEQECKGGVAQIQFTPALRPDRWALEMAQMFRDELRSEAGVNELYVDSLITMFGIHLLREYGAPSFLKPAVNAKLSRINQQRISEFIAANFTSKLTVSELAELCGLSQGYFITAFTNTFGERPHQFLIKRRLDHAQRLLVESDMQIAEIALLSGFSSQSHLTASIRRTRGLTPNQVRSTRNFLCE